MKTILKRIFLKRMQESDLNQESAKAGSYYLKQTGGKHLPIKDQSDTVNHVAHGFSMGVRWYEEQIGVKNVSK